MIQYNKRDLPEALSVETLRRHLNPWYPRIPDVEAVANDPKHPGVFMSLKSVVKQILIRLKRPVEPSWGPIFEAPIGRVRVSWEKFVSERYWNATLEP